MRCCADFNVHSTALDQLKATFGELILSDQDCFASEEGWQNLLELIPDKCAPFTCHTFFHLMSHVLILAITNSLREEWAADPDRSSSDKWNDFKREIKRETKAHSAKKADQCLVSDS
jgi:DNA primase small subunit